MEIPEMDLPKLAGAASSAVGLIISNAILLSWQTARYVPTFDRYRSLTGELRGHDDENTRRHTLRKQINALRCRLRLLSRAAGLLSCGLFCTFVTIITSGIALLYPDFKSIGYVGGATLFAALVINASAVGFMWKENRVDWNTIHEEAADFPELSEEASCPASTH